jgi:hypothetical protein
VKLIFHLLLVPRQRILPPTTCKTRCGAYRGKETVSRILCMQLSHACHKWDRHRICVFEIRLKVQLQRKHESVKAQWRKDVAVVTVTARPVITPVTVTTRPVITPVTVTIRSVITPVTVTARPVITPVTVTDRPVITPVAYTVIWRHVNIHELDFLFFMICCACLCGGHGKTYTIKQSAMYWGQDNMTFSSTQSTCSHATMLPLRLLIYTSSYLAIQFTVNNLEKQVALAGKESQKWLKITPRALSLSLQMGILYVSSVRLASRIIAWLGYDS